MGVQDVFRSLLELFPQVDIRILKAVAIEHSSDVDAAVEFILSEVLPSMVVTNQVVPSGKQVVDAVNSTVSSGYDSVACGSALSDEPATLGHHKSWVREAGEGSGKFSDESNACLLSEDSLEKLKADYAFPGELTTLDCHNSSVREAGEGSGKFSDEYNKCLISVDRLEKLIAERPLSDAPTGSNDDELISNFVPEQIFVSFQGSEEVGNNAMGSSSQILHESVANETVLSVNGDSSVRTEQLKDGTIIEVISQDLNGLETKGTLSILGDHSPAQGNHKDLRDVGSGVVKDITDSTTEHDDCQSGYAVEGSDSSTFDTVTVSADNSSMPLTVTTRSGYVVSIDMLEDLIADAKNSKKTMASAIEMVSNMAKEVELLEERAKQSKEEASTAGEDILTKVEEMKQTLKHAMEAYDMHAGEVNAEKAILATETRELQCRLLSLSNERSRSLSTIEEIHETIEARLAAAKKEIAADEEKKLEKVELANKFLHEQEVIMNALVEESRKLQQDAEENSKLREFLMDHGHVVDVLQGEIAVISEDVILLKERVDGRMPLSRSLSMMMSKLSASSNASSNSISDKSVASLIRAPSPAISDKSVASLIRAPSPAISDKSVASLIRAPSPVGSIESLRITDQNDTSSQLEDIENNGNGSLSPKQKSVEDGWELFDTQWAFA